MRPAAACWIATLALLLGCGGEESTPAPAPSPTPTPAAASSAAPTPAASSAVCAVPAGSLRGDAKAGELAYNQICLACHGPDAPPLQPPPANHRDCAYMGSLSDEHLYKVICGGGPAVGKSAAMAPWGAALPPDAIKGVIAHLRSFCPS